MTLSTSEIRFCSTCFGRLYLVIAEPLRWVHVSTDSVTCPSKDPS